MLPSCWGILLPHQMLSLDVVEIIISECTSNITFRILDARSKLICVSANDAIFYYHIPLLTISAIFLGLWWRLQMQTFSALLAFCVGNSSVTGEFPAQRPVTRSFDVFLDLSLDLANNREVGDLRRHRAHYDVIVMHIYLFTGAKANDRGLICFVSSTPCLQRLVKFIADEWG